MLTPAATEFFRCHDVVHVGFGCDISLVDEVVVKMSSIFGTTAGFGVLKGYKLQESKEIYKQLQLAAILVITMQSLVLIPRAI